MKILLTNDDGYEAYGLNLLSTLLQKYGDIFVVAPKCPHSAKSVSIVLDRPIEVVKKNEHLYVTDGTPADCVAYGLSSLGVKFDLVISGINHGPNLSYDTMYSGTVGACLQALTYEVPAIAISCDNNFEIVEKNLDELLNYIFNLKILSKEYVLNVNFPVGDEVKGILDTHLYYRNVSTFYEEVKPNYFQAKRYLDDEHCIDTKSDIYAVNHGYISISKLNKKLG